MSYSNFLQEHQGRRIDFDHSGVYLASDLIREYTFKSYKLSFEIPSLAEIWTTPPADLIDFYYQSNDVTVKEGDIVILGNHGGISSGEQTPEKFVLLEQNFTGSGRGDGDDAIRENWYEKASITGIYRARFSPDALGDSVPATVEPVEEVVEETEPATPVAKAKPYKHPTGALRVPLNRVKFTMVVQVAGYDYMSHAQKHQNKVADLIPGTYYMLRQDGGVAKIDKGEGTKSYWFDPKTNVLPPVIPDYYQDTRTGYKYYDDPIRYKFVDRDKEAFVDSFSRDRKHVKLPYNYRIWIGGTCVVPTPTGDILYGLPLNQVKNADGNLVDNEFTELPSYGVRMSYLELDQMDYKPDEQISDVRPAEAEAFLPLRTVSLKDRNVVLKGKAQRVIDGFLKPKRR